MQDDLAFLPAVPRGTLDLRCLMLSCHGIRQTLEGSFSAVSKPNFASKYAFESSRRDLHNALLCTAPKSHFFQKISGIVKDMHYNFFYSTDLKKPQKTSEILRNPQKTSEILRNPQNSEKSHRCICIFHNFKLSKIVKNKI